MGFQQVRCRWVHVGTAQHIPGDASQIGYRERSGCIFHMGDHTVKLPRYRGTPEQTSILFQDPEDSKSSFYPVLYSKRQRGTVKRTLRCQFVVEQPGVTVCTHSLLSSSCKFSENLGKGEKGGVGSCPPPLPLSPTKARPTNPKAGATRSGFGITTGTTHTAVVMLHVISFSYHERREKNFLGGGSFSVHILDPGVLLIRSTVYRL